MDNGYVNVACNYLLSSCISGPLIPAPGNACKKTAESWRRSAMTPFIVHGTEKFKQFQNWTLENMALSLLISSLLSLKVDARNGAFACNMSARVPSSSIYNYFVYLPIDGQYSISLFGRIKNKDSLEIFQSHYFDITFGARCTSTKTFYIKIIAHVFYVFN